MKNSPALNAISKIYKPTYFALRNTLWLGPHHICSLIALFQFKISVFYAEDLTFMLSDCLLSILLIDVLDISYTRLQDINLFYQFFFDRLSLSFGFSCMFILFFGFESEGRKRRWGVFVFS